MKIVVTWSGSVYRIDEKGKRIVCKKRGLDRYYESLCLTRDNRLKINFSDKNWMQTRKILFKF